METRGDQRTQAYSQVGTDVIGAECCWKLCTFGLVFPLTQRPGSSPVTSGVEQSEERCRKGSTYVKCTRDYCG